MKRDLPAWRKTGLVSAFALFSLLYVFTLSPAEEKSFNPTLERGIGLYKHENYDEALPVLKQAKEEEPDSTLAAFYLGLNYKQLQNYRLAIPHLREAVTKSPKIKGALIELIDCLYQYNELEEAHRWVEEAEREGIRPAQIAFLKGLIRVKESKYPAAVESFEKAKALDRSMEQSADYQIGIAHLKSKRYADAKKAFAGVIDVEAASPLAKFATEYMDAITLREESLGKPWRFAFGTFWEYDDNVVLKPDLDSAALNIADEADWRTVYTTNTEYTHRSDDDRFSLKAGHLLYFAKQNDLGFYDTLTNSVVLQPNFYSENDVWSFPVAYTHTIVDDRSYLSTPSVSGVYNHVFGENNMGQVYAKYDNKNFMWTPSTADEDRDANGAGAGAGWYTFFAQRKGFVNVRYGLDRQWTEGNNWDHLGHQVYTTAQVPWGDKLKVNVTGGVFFQDFTNTHTVFGVGRRDDVYTASTQIAYEFLKDWEFQVRYTHVQADSNIDIYEYSRNIYGAGVEVKF